jgi:integron integrase
MEQFKHFLISENIIPEDKVLFYVSWLLRFYAFCGKKPGENVSQMEVDRFLMRLSKTREEPQVKQAEEAIELYRYVLKQEKPPEAGEDHEPDDPWKTAEGEMEGLLRIKRRSSNTAKTYMGWLTGFRRFLNGPSPETLEETHVRDYLSHLDVDRGASPSTRRQAFNALLFFYRHVLGKDLSSVKKETGALRTVRLPVILTKQEVFQLFDQLDGASLLMAQITYGCGLTLHECLTLRVRDLDFDRNSLTVRGDKDRQTVLPGSLKAPLQEHLHGVRELYEQDRGDDIAGVRLPGNIEEQYPNAGKEWIWQWTFPSRSRTLDPLLNMIRRDHIHHSTFQRQIKQAAKQAGIPKQVTVHALRHSFAAHLLEGGYDIRTIQELLGHSNVRTTMVYTRVAGRDILGVRSPLDP